jgi:tyrosine-protein kinase Etk/Wzc
MEDIFTELAKPKRTTEGSTPWTAERDPGSPLPVIEALTQLALRKRLIAGITAAGLAAGLVLALALPVRYTATTKLLPPQQAQNSASMMMSQFAAAGGSPLAALAGGGLGIKNPNDLYVGMLTSRPVADAIIRQFELSVVYGSRDMTAARKRLAEFTSVVSEKNGFISISVTDRDRKRAAAMARAYIEQLRMLTKTLAVTEAAQRRVYYEEQLRQAKDALVAAELDFQGVQQSRGLVQLDAQAKAMIESLAALRAQVSAKQVQVEGLRSYSTERNPALAMAEKELASLQAEEARLEERNPTPGFAHLGLKDVPGAGLEYLRADHELRYRQALFDLLMKQYDAARLDESKDAAIIQVVEPAIEPDRRSSPKRAMLIALFAIGSFLLGVLFAMVRWWADLISTDPMALQQVRRLRLALTLKK